jgi:hypothetical protein
VTAVLMAAMGALVPPVGARLLLVGGGHPEGHLDGPA